MKIILAALMGLSAFSYAASEPLIKVTPVNPNKQLLESPFPVYLLPNNGVINHPYPGAMPALLPTDNSYKEAPGCYIACYSHNKGVYPVTNTIFVMGQVRGKRAVC